MKLGIMGGGSWGTALAIQWARKGHLVTLWARNEDDVRKFNEAGCNTKYLPDSPFPENLTVTADLDKTLTDNQLICLAIPLQAYRAFLENIKDKLVDFQQLLLLSKGVELDTYLLPTGIVKDVLGKPWLERTFTLSGPSFAKEVADGKPTTVVLSTAGVDTPRLETLQKALNCASLRTYTNTDIVGVELAGALKNVIAIAGGIAHGLDLGHNTTAALITRGLSEISRLGVALGAKRSTFAGLSGMGDLILTCTGSLSRNRRVGMELAKGVPLDEALKNLGMVAEGVQTSRSAYQMGVALKVDLPISNAVYQILFRNLHPVKALEGLMSRRLKAEFESR